MIPWFLMQLTPRDMSGELLRLVNFRDTTNLVAASSGGVSYNVPAERLLVLASWGMRTVGALPASVNVAHSLRISDASGFVKGQYFNTSTQRNNAAGRPGMSSAFPCFIVVPEKYQVTLFAEFDTGGAHDVEGSFSGVLVPKGQMSLY